MRSKTSQDAAHLFKTAKNTACSNPRQGFTLVEIMIVVAIIGLLSVLAIPSFIKARQESRISSVANDLRIFGDAFNLYSINNGLYPVDTHNTLPPGMEEYIKQQQWDSCPMGGHYNWEGPSWGEGGSYAYAGIALWNTPANQRDLTRLDERIDDGDLSTGNFRLMSNSRYTYVLEE